MKKVETALLLYMIISYFQMRNSSGKPVTSLETSSTYMDLELTSNNEGATLSNNNNTHSMVTGNLTTVTSESDQSLLSGEVEAPNDNAQVALESTPTEPAVSQVIPQTYEDETISAVLGKDLNGESSTSHKMPFKVSDLNNGGHTVTQDPGKINVNSHLLHVISTTTYDTELSSLMEKQSENEYQSTPNRLANNNVTEDPLKDETEKDKGTVLITFVEFEQGTGAVTELPVVNNEQDIISDTGGRDATTEAASSSDSENISVQQSETYNYRYNSLTEATAGNYHYSDANKSFYPSNTEYNDYSSVKYSDGSTVSNNELTFEYGTHNGVTLVPTISTSSPFHSTTTKGPAKAKSTTKSGQALQPVVWTAKQLILGALIGILTIAMTIALFIVVLWRRRSYYHNTRNILHLQEFKTFQR